MADTLRTRAQAALAHGLAFLEKAQLATGEFRVFTSLQPDMADPGTPDPAVFPTALALHCLNPVPGTEAIRAKAAQFLHTQRDRNGLWRHWQREHPLFATLPADADDTACASAALADMPDMTRTLLLANRDRQGRFLTWFVPDLRWRGCCHASATLPLLRHPLVLAMFFRKTSAAPGDVDAGVNANVLCALGRFDGHEAVVDYLLGVLREGREADADKWYDNPFVLWYLFARALVPLNGDAAPLLLTRMAQATPRTPLEQALAIATRITCGSMPEDQSVSALIDAQSADGSWPRAAVYFGGRERRRDGTLAPAHPDTPRWGSEELTTAFALEALARWLDQQP